MFDSGGRPWRVEFTDNRAEIDRLIAHGYLDRSFDDLLDAHQARHADHPDEEWHNHTEDMLEIAGMLDAARASDARRGSGRLANRA